MNSRGMSPILTGALVIMLLFIWAFFLGPALTVWGHAAAQQETGLQALILDYSNFFFFFIPLIIFIVASPSIPFGESR